MESRVSATCLKSVELDELTTDQIIINNEGLQYLHKYNILLPTMTEGFYNLQEEMDNIMISNTTQDLELIQLQSGLTTAQANITTLGADLVIVGGIATSALDLANQKSWILFFQKPLRSDISSNVYLDFDTNYFSVDASNNYLTLNTVLNAGSTYWFEFDYLSYGSGSTNIRYYSVCNSTQAPLNSSCTDYAQTSTNGIVWTDSNTYCVIGLYYSKASASYTTSISTASSWGSWTNFAVDETVPSSSTLTYYIKTSTANNNFASKTATPITNGQTISSSAGPYAQVIASFTRTDATVIPKLNEIKINYVGASNVEPIGYSYKDRAYFAVDQGSGYNDTILVYDANAGWTKLTGNVGGACLYKGNLMTGDSTNTGKVYYNDVSGLYTDNGVNYEAYWTTPVMSFDSTINEKVFKELWVTAKNEGTGSVDVAYKLYGTDASFTSFASPLNLYSSINALIVGKYNFPLTTKSYYGQFKIGSTNAYPFQIRKLDLIYEVSPRR
jgi:hypothetical protein